MFDKFIEVFTTGGTIDESRRVLGISRNLAIKKLKDHLGSEEYARIAKNTSISRRVEAARKYRTGKKAGPMPEETKQKISKSHVGLKHTKETREKISKSVIKRIDTHGPLRSAESSKNAGAKARETKIKNGAYERFSMRMKGRIRQPMPKESKTKMSESRKKFFERGGISWMKGKTHTQEVRAKLSNKTLEMWSSGKFKNSSFIFRSKLEIRVFDYLSSIYDCCHTFKIDTKLYDIYVKNLNLIIEVNGDYWHLNPLLYDSSFYDKSREIYATDLWEKDRCKAVKAIENGYDFCTIWQKDLEKDFIGAINEQLEKYTGGDRH